MRFEGKKTTRGSGEVQLSFDHLLIVFASEVRATKCTRGKLVSVFSEFFYPFIWEPIILFLFFKSTRVCIFFPFFLIYDNNIFPNVYIQDDIQINVVISFYF